MNAIITVYVHENSKIPPIVTITHERVEVLFLRIRVANPSSDPVVQRDKPREDGYKNKGQYKRKDRKCMLRICKYKSKLTLFNVLFLPVLKTFYTNAKEQNLPFAQ